MKSRWLLLSLVGVVAAAFYGGIAQGTLRETTTPTEREEP
jgi:hypothetical protein